MRRVAWLNLRFTLPERIAAFAEGLRRHGYEPRLGIPRSPVDGELFVTWNRIGEAEHAACRFEAAGKPVLVAENAAWGNGFLGERWYSIARNRHNTAGRVDYGGPERWDRLNVRLDDWREGGEIVILPQRGIGSPPTAMPLGWAQRAQRKWGGRIRPHPGTKPCLDLATDLMEAGYVVTWGSGAAILAALWGIQVHAEMPDWIGAHVCTEQGRLQMFRRLAWAQWRLSEIENGEAFARLL